MCNALLNSKEKGGKGTKATAKIKQILLNLMMKLYIDIENNYGCYNVLAKYIKEMQKIYWVLCDIKRNIILNAMKRIEKNESFYKT